MPFNYNHYLATLTATQIKFAPRGLFTEGNTTYLTAGSKVAVVGSRKASEQGLRNARVVTEVLVKHGAIVVSGLAEGIDTVAHETAIRAGGKTIAVLGTPLDIAYPAGNARLLAAIKRDHLAVSQFALGSPITKANFPLRNRIIALLSDAAIIVEEAENGGSCHLGWEVLRLGRPLFILKPMLEDNALNWPRQMAKYGARELTCEDLAVVLEDLPKLLSRPAAPTFF
jgi:DNA processing protein